MICGKPEALDAIKTAQKELNELLAQGKDGLAAMDAKMATLQSKLNEFKPTLPAVDSLQQALLGLSGVTDAASLAAQLAALKVKFGSAVPNFDSLMSSLGLSSFPPSINLANICAGVPNVEMENGVPVEKPKEPKVPEEEPKAEEPPPKILLDEYTANRDLRIMAYRLTIRQIERACLKIKPKGVRRKDRLKVQQEFFDLTYPEAIKEIAEAGGATFDELSLGDTPEEVIKYLQTQLLTKYPDVSWDFVAEGAKVKQNYDETKVRLAELFGNAGSFQKSCTEYITRVRARRAKEAEQEA